MEGGKKTSPRWIRVRGGRPGEETCEMARIEGKRSGRARKNFMLEDMLRVGNLRRNKSTGEDGIVRQSNKI